jgi:hypothetical protein
LITVIYARSVYREYTIELDFPHHDKSNIPQLCSGLSWQPCL